VREAAHAEACPLEVEAAENARGLARAGDRHGEPRRTRAAQPARDQGEGGEVRPADGGHGERPLAEEVHAAGDREVRSFPGQVEVGQLQAAAGEGEPHRVARPEENFGQRELELGDDRLRADPGRRLEGAANEDVAGGHDAERRGQVRAHRTEEGIEARRAQGEAEVGRIGGRGPHGSGDHEVHAGGAATPVDRHPAVAGADELHVEGPDALVAQEEAAGGERRAHPRPGERALHLHAAGEAAGEGGAGRRRGDDGPEVDTLHLARAVVDAVVGQTAAEGDRATADARLAPEDPGHAPLPSRDATRASSYGTA
jgi:hypothetical protein